MSSGATLRVSVVCEGDTDFPVIEGVLAAILDRDFVCTMIQPEVSAFAGSHYSEMGSGWTGVRNWCQSIRERYDDLGAAVKSQPLAAQDLLVLHVDADIAAHPQIDVQMPCPPASRTVNGLRAVVLEWSGDQTVPDRAVLCIPSKAIEAWVLCALHPRSKHCQPSLECRARPETLLVGKPDRLVRKKDGGYRKNVKNYRAAKGKITAGWRGAAAVCAEAKRFEDDVTAALAG